MIPFLNIAVNSLNKHHSTAINLRKGFLPTAKGVMTGHPSGCTLYDELGSFYEALGDAKGSMECRKEDIRFFRRFLGDHNSQQLRIFV